MSAQEREVAYWVFGYGSLLWNPGFDPVDRQLATLAGWQRSFCMWSIHHRGTTENPGLVLALDQKQGASCAGVAFGIGHDRTDDILTVLRERELVSSAYLETNLPITLADGRLVQAITYVVDPTHNQYCGGLTLERQAEVIAGATGGRGPNDVYLYNTVDHLHELELPDPDLDWLAARVREMNSSAGAPA